MGIKARIAKWLGIPYLRTRVNRLEELEMFSLADVCDRLSESMVVLTGTGQTLRDVEVIVGGDKTGVLVLGDYTTVQGGLFRPPTTETVTRIIEDYGEYTSLSPHSSTPTTNPAKGEPISARTRGCLTPLPSPAKEVRGSASKAIDDE